MVWSATFFSSAGARGARAAPTAFQRPMTPTVSVGLYDSYGILWGRGRRSEPPVRAAAVPLDPGCFSHHPAGAAGSTARFGFKSGLNQVAGPGMIEIGVAVFVAGPADRLVLRRAYGNCYAATQAACGAHGRNPCGSLGWRLRG